jgi:hypothetical protein
MEGLDDVVTSCSGFEGQMIEITRAEFQDRSTRGPGYAAVHPPLQNGNQACYAGLALSVVPIVRDVASAMRFRQGWARLRKPVCQRRDFGSYRVIRV